MIENRKRGFILATRDSQGNKVTFEFLEDHNAEQVLRGLVHSGFNVNIQEAIVTVPESFRQMREELNEMDRLQGSANVARLLHGGLNSPV